jgi:hypothetical protein
MSKAATVALASKNSEASAETVTLSQTKLQNTFFLHSKTCIQKGGNIIIQGKSGLTLKKVYSNNLYKRYVAGNGENSKYVLKSKELKPDFLNLFILKF